MQLFIKGAFCVLSIRVTLALWPLVVIETACWAVSVPFVLLTVQVPALGTVNV